MYRKKKIRDKAAFSLQKYNHGKCIRWDSRLYFLYEADCQSKSRYNFLE
jgi:hypothetical protein